MPTLIRCLLPSCCRVARETTRSFYQTCRWQVTPNTHTPFTQRSRRGPIMPSRLSLGTSQVYELIRNSPGSAPPQSSQLAELLWIGPGLKSGIGAHEHIIIIINPLTARVVGAPQMILQPVFSIFPCSPLPSGTCRTPGLSIP